MKRITTFCMALILLAGLAWAAGDASDPVVSLSWLEQEFTPDLKEEANRRISGGLGAACRDSLRDLQDHRAAVRLDARRAAAGTGRRDAGVLLCKRGDVLTLLPGCRLTVKYGSIAPDGALLCDISHGKRVASGTALEPETLYMAAGDCGLTVATASCELTINGVYRLSPGTEPDYGSMAAALDEMGLFRGAGARTGYNLEAGASRAEGLVMFLRVLGLEDEALAYQGGCPFADVPASHWAERYVAYAQARGLTTGTGPDRFSPDEAITCQQYGTFLLRALNYREKTDFRYDTALTDLANLGLFSDAEISSLSAGRFRRYQMVYLSYRALFGADQESGRLLMNRLTYDGSVDTAALARGLELVTGGPIGQTALPQLPN